MHRPSGRRPRPWPHGLSPPADSRFGRAGARCAARGPDHTLSPTSLTEQPDWSGCRGPDRCNGTPPGCTQWQDLPSRCTWRLAPRQPGCRPPLSAATRPVLDGDSRSRRPAAVRGATRGRRERRHQSSRLAGRPHPAGEQSGAGVAPAPDDRSPPSRLRRVLDARGHRRSAPAPALVPPAHRRRALSPRRCCRGDGDTGAAGSCSSRGASSRAGGCAAV